MRFRSGERLGIDAQGLVLHSDNGGGPMKGSTMLATLERLGIVASFSRPRVSDDNPYSQALFRTLKYRPRTVQVARNRARAGRRFRSLAQPGALAQRHRVYVTPAQRHAGADEEILEQRRRVYERAREQNPERWSRGVRSWDRPDVVRLNPQRHAAASDAQNARLGQRDVAAELGLVHELAEPQAGGAHQAPEVWQGGDRGELHLSRARSHHGGHDDESKTLELEPALEHYPE